MRYELKEDCRVGVDEDEVPAIIAEFEKVEQKYGTLVPLVVVERAREPSNPLHRHFEWDDNVAAHQHRLKQARDLIGSFRVVIEKDGNEMKAPAYVVELEGSKNGYRKTMDVLSSESGRQVILRRAIRDLAAWERRYAHLSELADVLRGVRKQRLKAEGALSSLDESTAVAS